MVEATYRTFSLDDNLLDDLLSDFLWDDHISEELSATLVVPTPVSMKDALPTVRTTYMA